MAGRRYDTTARDAGDSVAALGDLHDDGLRPKAGLIRVVIDKLTSNKPGNQTTEKESNGGVSTRLLLSSSGARRQVPNGQVNITGTGTPGR